MVESVRSDIRKYIKRERRKELPEDIDFWDFDCKFGDTEAAAEKIHIAEISKCIGDAEKRQLESFYVEILAKPGHRTRKPVTVSDDAPPADAASEAPVQEDSESTV